MCLFPICCMIKWCVLTPYLLYAMFVMIRWLQITSFHLWNYVKHSHRLKIVIIVKKEINFLSRIFNPSIYHILSRRKGHSAYLLFIVLHVFISLDTFFVFLKLRKTYLMESKSLKQLKWVLWVFLLLCCINDIYPRNITYGLADQGLHKHIKLFFLLFF